MKIIFSLLIAFFALTFLLAGSYIISKKNAIERKPDVVLEESYNSNLVKNIDIDLTDEDDDDSNTNKELGKQAKSYEAPARMGADSSSIDTMIDGFGNKVETRTFDNHPLLKCVVLKTFANGKKIILAYAQNGDVKTLSKDFSDNALSYSANDIAAVAKITEGRKENPALQNQQQKAEQTESSREPAPKNAAIENPQTPKEKTDTAPTQKNDPKQEEFGNEQN